MKKEKYRERERETKHVSLRVFFCASELVQFFATLLETHNHFLTHRQKKIINYHEEREREREKPQKRKKKKEKQKNSI